MPVSGCGGVVASETAFWLARVSPRGAPISTYLNCPNSSGHLSLAWSSTDNSGSALYYVVSRDGVSENGTSATSGTFSPLRSSTTYVFSAKARDNADNWSAVSAAFYVTTPAPDANDVTAPTTPTNLRADLFADGSRELDIAWSASTDAVTPQRYVRYEVFLNGVFEDSLVGKTSTIAIYGEPGDNTITVFAFDEAGNKSAAATAKIFIPL